MKGTKKKANTLSGFFTKRSLRRLRHLHLRRSLFPHNRLCLRHLYRNLTLSPASSTIIHLRLFPTQQTRNRFHHSHIRLQLQVTLICESLIYAIRVVIIIDYLIAR